MKKKYNDMILYLIVALIVAMIYFIAKLYFYKNINIKRDVSLDNTHICDITERGTIWLISYAHGEVYYANQRALNHSAINKCIDHVKSYNIKFLDSVFKEKNTSILTQERGAGYWLWKPYIIYDTLKSIPDDDIVIYLDTGVMIHSPIDKMINLLEHNKDIMLFNNFHTNKGYIKRDLLKMMNMDNDTVLNTTHIAATFLLIKNSEFSRRFIKEWLDMSQNEHAINDVASEDEYVDFIDHRHDQAILSLLSIKYQDNIQFMDLNVIFNYCYVHKRRSKNASLFDCLESNSKLCNNK